MESTFANLTPGAGFILGTTDAYQGEDSITGESLSPLQRGLAFLGIAGTIGAVVKGASMAGKVAKAADKVADCAPDPQLFRGGSTLAARLGIDVKQAADKLIHPIGNNGKPQGLSLNIDPKDFWVQEKGGAFPVLKIAEGLQMVQSGKPGHFVISPVAPMPFEEFNKLLAQTILGNFNLR
jgi:Pre-toxin TG